MLSLRQSSLGQAAPPAAATATAPDTSSSSGSLVLGGVVAVGLGALLYAASAGHDRQWRTERGLSIDY
jgi:hypothetical protein